MEDEIVPEGLNEWQQIDPPFLIPNCSEFSRFDHEQLNLEALDSLSSLSPLEMSSSADEEAEEDEAKTKTEEIEQRLTQRLGTVGSEIILAACKLKNHLLTSILTGFNTNNNRIAILLSTAASGTLLLVLLSLFYKKMQRKPHLETTHKFMILIHEKDQRISQLLLQISRMNELLQARRKVPVIRVG